MIDFEKIKAIYKFSKNLTLNDLQVIIKSAQERTFLPKDEYFIKEGSLKQEVFFIIEGLVRSFKINNKGEEITTYLWWENQSFLGSYDTILFNQPSRFFYAALEPTKVLTIEFEVLQSIVSKNPKLVDSRESIVQYTTRQLMKRLDSFILLSPEERYIEFINANPAIVNRVPDKYIANVLGITPVSLSRIRKRIAVKKG